MIPFRELIETFQAYAKVNPVVAGLAGIWTTGIITAVLIKFPRRVWAFLVRQFTTTLTIDNSDLGLSVANFAAFLTWFEDQEHSRWSRSFSMSGTYRESGNRYNESMVYGIGVGRHWFRWKHRMFFLEMENVEKAGTIRMLQRIHITMIGRSHKAMHEFVDAFRYRPDGDALGVYIWDGSWSRIADVPPRHLDTVIIDPKVKQELVDALDWYMDNKDWYVSRGLPYKHAVFLYGMPGNGKSSMIKALASKYGMNLCMANLNSLSDRELMRAVSSMPENSMLAFEDIDDVRVLHAREGMEANAIQKLKSKRSQDLSDRPTSRYEDHTLTVDMGALTLSGILNVFGGVVPLDNRIIFFTTNRPEILDAAFLRTGRIDQRVEVLNLTHREVHEYLKLMYKDTYFDYIHDRHDLPVFADISGSDLENLYIHNRDNIDAMVRAIPTSFTCAPLRNPVSAAH